MNFLRPIAFAAACTVAAVAHAGVAIEGTGRGVDSLSRTTAEKMVVEPGGLGHVQLIPYFGTHAGNATLFAITNQDEVNGKVLKVRFRSAGNGDTVFDFTLFLGAGDSWSANVSQGASGVAQLVTADTSCTLPAISRLDFNTAELPPATAQFTAADRDLWTREGFVEIINAADIPPTLNAAGRAGQENPMFRAIDVVAADGPPPCASSPNGSAAMGALATDVSNEADAVAKGLDTPSGLISVWAMLMNVQNAYLSWGIEGTALGAVDAQGRPGRGRLVVSPQTADAVETGRASALTADALITQGRLVARQYHFPDLSTPCRAGSASAAPFDQATAAGLAMAATQFSNQYSAAPNINSMTDLVVTQPMKRYFVGFDYQGASDADRLVFPRANGFYRAASTQVSGNRACSRFSADTTAYGKAFDRSGRRIGDQPTGPVTIGFLPFGLAMSCGGTTNYNINGGPDFSLLKSPKSLRQSFFTSFQEGWVRIDTPGAGTGVPLIGLSFSSAVGAPVAGMSTNFGWAVKHKTVPYRP